MFSKVKTLSGVVSLAVRSLPHHSARWLSETEEAYPTLWAANHPSACLTWLTNLHIQTDFLLPHFSREVESRVRWNVSKWDPNAQQKRCTTHPHHRLVRHKNTSALCA
jgi:hypothetical protein